MNIEEVSTEYTDDNGVTFVDVYCTGTEEGCVAAYIINREVYWKNDDLRDNATVLSVINDFLSV